MTDILVIAMLIYI